MKRQASLFCAGIALIAVLAVGSGYAQSHLKLHADIPFEFVASNVTFPAGHYTVRVLQPGRVLIQSDDYRNAGIVMTIPKATGRTSEKTKLMFNRYGEKYFLSQIWTQGEGTGRQLLKSRAEREIVAKLKSDQPTTIAATVK